MCCLQLACKSGLDSRALTLCESMPSVEVVQLASKYAAKIGKQHLASKVNEIARNMNKPRCCSIIAVIIPTFF